MPANRRQPDAAQKCRYMPAKKAATYTLPRVLQKRAIE